MDSSTSGATTSSCPHTTNPTARDRSPIPPKMSNNLPTTTANGIPPLTPSSDPDNLYQPPIPGPSTTLAPSGNQIASSLALETDVPLRSESTFILGTRKSQLALVQTKLVASELSTLHSSRKFNVEWMTTLGDRNQQTPLHLLTPYSQQQPAKSLWTDELEARLMSGHFDMLVHSLKDVPTTLKDGCELACMLEREDPRDVFVVKKGLKYKTLGELPEGSIVGTGSVRRVAQLKRAYPGLRFEDMRGNVNTRLGKLDAPESQFVGLILAASGLSRIGLQDRITSSLSSPDLYHAIGQGALGVEIRSGDGRVRETIRGAGHWPTEWRCGAERGCLRVLEGGCSVPVGIETSLEEVFEDPSTSGTNGSSAEEIMDSIFQGETFPPLEAESPMLWFSGIVDSAHRLPASLPQTPNIFSDSPILPPNPTLLKLGSASGTGTTTPDLNFTLPPIKRRLAKMTLSVCVTSLDGSIQVVYSPPSVLVRNYQQAERFGEICATRAKDLGARDILEEVGRLRRERERKDLERALEKSRQAAAAAKSGNEGGSEGNDEHQGLQGLVQNLMGANSAEQ